MMNRIPPQLMQIFQSKNPQQMVLGMLGKMNNPIAQNVVNLAQNGDYGAVEQIVRNVCSSRGISADEMMNELKQYM